PSFLKPLHNDRVVLPAEAKAVAHGNVTLGLPRFVRDIIQIAFRIWLREIHRGRENLIANRQYAGDKFHRAGGGDEVAHHSLDAADRDVFGMLTEDLLDGAGFVAVVLARAGTVGVDVLDIFWRQV